jgi:hydroxymethylbilane synthase
MTASPVRLGTRGSALALVQAGLVKGRLEAAHPGLAVEIVPIKSTGDKLADVPFNKIPGKGVFIKEIEEALAAGRVELAVHSLKDLPTEATPGLCVAAVLEREDPRDCVVSRFGEQLLELPRGALVGTGSLRRQAQVRAAKDKIRVREIRGNLDTRLRKVLDGEYDSIVVAYAGVRRLGRTDDVSEVLPFELMLPAPGQGCLAVETRADDARSKQLAAALHHPASARAAEAERAFLAALGGGCRVPIAAYAREEAGKLVLDGLVIAPDGKKQARGRESGSPGAPAALGRALAERLRGQGAGEILAGVEATDGSES